MLSPLRRYHLEKEILPKMRLKMHLKTVFFVGLLSTVFSAGTVGADTTGEAEEKPVVETTKFTVPLPPQDKQYQEETPEDIREKARAIFHRANERFEQRRHDDALQDYEQAYSMWPHPRVLFNIAVTLGYLARPLESAEKFREVLRYGPEPITPERYRQATDRYMELMGQLAQILIVSNDNGARVFVNGRPIGTAPLEQAVTLGPGTHMISATLSGKIPYSEQIRLEPGTRARIEIVMTDFADVVRYKTVNRYHWALPASVTLAAGGLLASGIALVVQGRQHIDDIQSDIDRQILEFGRARPFTYDTNLERRAINQQIAGQVLMGASGAVAVTATILWIVRKKRVSFTETEADRKSTDPKVQPHGAGVEIRF